MNTIFQKISEELKNSNDLVLVTIVAQSGSSPRGLGAQMLIGSGGRICGTVGGGAVEHHCEEEAVRLLGEKTSGIRHFSLRRGGAEDIGMVCGGDVSAWFQFIDSSVKEWETLSENVLDLLGKRSEGWLAMNKSGAVSALLNKDGELLSGSLDGTFSAPAKKEFLETEDAYYLPITVRDRAVIFGGGHCSQALVPFLNRTGFSVTVMDNRPEFAQEELFPEADCIICGDYLKISDYVQLTESDYVVIMTNGHSHDYEVELQVLQNPTAYVGVIGSRSKIAFTQKKLREAGIPEDVINSVHSPIGTPIKAVTPAEIAVSITGEMIYERALLREKNGTAEHGCPMH